jgi:hypothetical protein
MLRDRLGRESNTDAILDDIKEIERNNNVVINTDKQHVIFTSVLFDLILISKGTNIIVKIETRFQINYDEFVTVLVPVEEEIVVSDKEISKDIILRLVDSSLKKLKKKVIEELKK